MKIEKCPFCGGTPILELFNDGFFDYARIRCCRVMFDRCGDKTGEQAIAARNRRADTENKPLTLDELGQLREAQIPIWMGRAKEWIFVASVADAPYAQVWYSNAKGFAQTVLYHHEKFYRSKPKEEHYETD